MADLALPETAEKTAEEKELEKARQDLAVAKDAASPQDACEDIRRFIAENSKKDFLTGTAEEVNPWIGKEPEKLLCCTIA